MSETSQAEGVGIESLTDDEAITPDGLLDVLGYGYNVLSDGYARKEAVKRAAGRALELDQGTGAQILSRAAGVEYLIPAGVSRVMPLNTMQLDEVEASTVLEVSKKFAAKAKLEGGYGAFSAEAKASVSMESDLKKERYFSGLFEKRCVCEAYLNTDTLTTGFKAELDDADVEPEVLFEKWGTHIVTGVQIGGCLRLSASIQKSETSTQEEFSAHTKAKYAGVTGSSSASASASASESIETAASFSQTHVLTMGGDPALLFETEDGTPSGFADWVASVERMPDFVDFAAGGLQPVWDYCSQPDRADALREAYMKLGGTLAIVADSRELRAATKGQYETEVPNGPLRSCDTLAEYRDRDGRSDAAIWQCPSDGPGAARVLCGIGLNINKDNKRVAHMVVEWWDLATDTYGIETVKGDLKKIEDCQTGYQAPTGYALSGLALKVNSNHHAELRGIDMVRIRADGSFSSASSSSSADCDLGYGAKPSEVLTGILVASGNEGSNGKHRVNRLVVETARLQLE